MHPTFQRIFRTAVVLLPLLLAGGCATHRSKRSLSTAHVLSGKITVRTTAYTHSEPGGRKNGVGGRLRYGGSVYSAASDWSWMPLGTRFKICSTGTVHVVEDYGSALVGRKTIDLYLPSRRAVHAWGVRQIEIEILEWGSRAMSLKLLEGRMKNQHVREMVASLRAQKDVSSM